MRFKLHEGISIDMVIALFASHFSNLRERAAMNGTKVPQEESLISATEYKERSKEALSRIARSMSDNIAAQAIALVCSLALLLGKISLGYFAIDRSAPFEKQQLSVLRLFQSDTGCLIAFLAFILTILFFLWKGTYCVFLEAIEKRRRRNLRVAVQKSHLINIIFQLAQIGIPLTVVYSLFPEVFGSVQKTNICNSAAFAFLAMLICFYHVLFLCGRSFKSLAFRKPAFSTLKMFAAAFAPALIASFVLFLILRSDCGTTLHLVCFLYYAYQSIWLVAYGLLYKVDSKNAQRKTDPKDRPKKPERKLPLQTWRLRGMLVFILFSALIFFPMVAIVVSFSKAFAGVVVFTYQIFSFLGL